MKTRLLIIIGIIMMTTIPFVTFAALDRYENYLEQLEYERQRVENEPKPGERSYIEPELKAKLESVELDLREKVRQLHEDLPPSSYAVNLNHQTKEIEAVIENKELIPIIKEFTKKYPDDVSIIVEYGKISFGDPLIFDPYNQECARLFDKIFYTWEKHVDENYGKPGQPILEPPSVWGLIADWEGGEEFRDSDCRYTVNNWAYLVEYEEQVWGHVDWPKLEPFFYTEPVPIKCKSGPAPSDEYYFNEDTCEWELENEN